MVGLDQERRAEPPQAGDEIAEAPDTSRVTAAVAGVATRRAVAATAAVDQPDGDRQRRQDEGGQGPKGGIASAPTGAGRESDERRGATPAR